MKAIFFLAALFVSVYAEYKLATGEDLVKFRDECVTKLEIAPESVTQFKRWEFTDPKSADYILCVFEKMDLFEEGHFIVDNLSMQLSGGHPTDELKTQIQGCINDTLEGAEKAFNGFNCFKENNLYMVKRSVGATQ